MEYQEWLFRKQSNYYSFWIMVCFILIFSFFFLTCFSYHPYYQVIGFYNKEGNYVSVLFESTRLETLENVEIKVDKQNIIKENVRIIDYIVVDNKIYDKTNIYLEEHLDKQLVTVSLRLPRTTVWKQIWKGLIK